MTRRARALECLPVFVSPTLPAYLLACLLVCVLGACSRGGTEERLRARDRLVVAMISDPKTFNPLLSTDGASSESVNDVFEGLVRMNPRTTLPEPLLAERWEHDEAGTTWTFHIRRDVHWHDGTPLTAADVAFTFEAIYHPKVPNSVKHILVAGGEPIGVEVIDPYTVRLRLAEPLAPLLNGIGFAILPKHILGPALADGTFVQQWGIDTPPATIVGTGPYRLAQYEPAQFLHYERNDDYWMKDEDGAELPRIAERTILIVPDQNTTYLKFLDRQLHVHSPRPEEVADLRERASSLDATLENIGLDTGMLFVAFNRNPAHYEKNGKRDPRLKWFTDRRFLRAVAHSIDKASMIQNTFYGYGEAAVASVSPANTLFHNAGLQPYDYDLERARALLEEAGYVDRDGDGLREDADGNVLEFELTTNTGNQVRERLCAILKEDWAKLGLEVHYRPLDFAALVGRLQDSFDWDAMVMGFTGGIEPHNGANLWRSSGNLHLWHPNQETPVTAWEAEIDDALARGAREIDLERRRGHYWKIQEILHRELPVIQLVRQHRYLAYKTYLTDYAPTVWGLYRPELIAIQH